MHFEIVGKIRNIKTIAIGGSIRDMKKTRKKIEKKFVLCVGNEECDDLELRKVYEVIPDARAAKEGFVRIVDESGDDYLYPESYFTPVRLTHKAQDAVLVAS